MKEIYFSCGAGFFLGLLLASPFTMIMLDFILPYSLSTANVLIAIPVLGYAVGVFRIPFSKNPEIQSLMGIATGVLLACILLAAYLTGGFSEYSAQVYEYNSLGSLIDAGKRTIHAEEFAFFRWTAATFTACMLVYWVVTRWQKN